MGKVTIFGGAKSPSMPAPWAPPANFADATWADVIRACEERVVPATWEVGDQKSMTINGTDYLIDIIGKNHDVYSDGSGTAPLTFQLHDCYGTKYPINSEITNVGGWTNCVMRTTHLPAILALMPSEVQTGIKEVNKLTSAGGQSATINTSADKLFLLSEIEIFGQYEQSAAGEGNHYGYYSAGNSTIKNIGGSAVGWWTRSPKLTSESFAYVRTGGGIGNMSAASENGVSFAFCF